VGVALPACFDGFWAVAADGKKVKNAAKRLKPTRGDAGKLLGAKALVGLDLRAGLAVAMSDSLDGMANDVPLVPALMGQLRDSAGARPLLTVWDRQFDDVGTMRHLSARPGDAFVVRAKQLHARFAAESSAEATDAAGRRVRDDVGVLGTGARAARVRRVWLSRDAAGGEDDVVLLTDLLDRAAYPAADLLALYRERWGIEAVFQQATETFALGHLIGSSPRAVLFQLAYCLLLHDLMQAVRAYVAADGRVLASAVSMFFLFDDVRRELSAWAYHTDGRGPRAAGRGRVAMRRRCAGGWASCWPGRGTRSRTPRPRTGGRGPAAADRRPRPKPPPRPLLSGGHTSVQRLLEGKVRLAKG
jgi:hypothetical protein